MQYSMILAVLSLVLALISLGTSVSFWVSSRKRNRAIFDYIDQSVTPVEIKADSAVSAVDDTENRILNELNGIQTKAEQSIEEIRNKLEELELDYSTAQKAAKHINDFAGSIAEIFDYDPVSTLRENRRNNGG